MGFPYAMVRHGRDDIPVLLGLDATGNMGGLDLVEGRFLALDPGDVGVVFDTDPVAVYFGIQLAWARSARLPMAAEEPTRREVPVRDLPGHRDEFGVDFSGYGIPGTNCANCRALLPELRCKSPAFTAASIPEQNKHPGDNRIPIRSGNPADYCCNAWALDPRAGGVVEEAVPIPIRAELGRKFMPILTTDPFSVPVTGFDEVRSQLLRHRAEVPSVETIRLTTIFAGLTVGVGIAQAEKGFKCLVDLFKHTSSPSIEQVRGCIWSLGYHQIRERLYNEVPRWAPVAQEAIKKGLKDRELREHLFLHTELPAGISLAKLSFVLALLGHNVVCLDVRILDRMFGAGMASQYSGTWDTHSKLSLTRYERVEDSFLRGNPFYRPSDPIGRARAQWMSWESAGAPARAETHSVWLNVVR